MNRKEIIEFLNLLEKKFPVDKWRVCGIDVWPLLKIKTFFLWFEQNENSANGTDNVVQKKILSINKLLTSIRHWINLYRKKNPLRRFIFSGADSHRADFIGQSYNRYFDPIMDFIEQELLDKPLLFEQNTLLDKNYFRRDRILCLTEFYPFANILIKIKYKGPVVTELNKLRDFNECLDAIANTLIPIKKKYIQRQMVYTIQSVLVWAFIFDRIFKRLKPTYVFGLCYYSLKMYGMNVSAHRLGLPSVDMMHGTQGPLHVAYSNFNKVPLEGYNVLPKIFWCWDLDSANNISNWASQQKYHRVIIGGNPWMQFFNTIAEEKWRHMKKIILYTMQPIDPLLDNYIIKAIKNTDEKFEWWLRLHPRQLDKKPILIDLLRQNEIIDMVNIDDASNYPLPIILRHAHVHISKFSGTIIEASLSGVPNIIIDRIGVAAYANEIINKKAIAMLEKDPDSLVQLISKITRDEYDYSSQVRFQSCIIDNFTS